MATTNEHGHSSKVHLTLHVPKGRSKPMRKLFKPYLQPADPSLSLLHVHESDSPISRSELKPREDVPKYCVDSEALTTPALNVMTFLPEDGTVEDAHERLQGFPWKFHHRIELQNSYAGDGGGCCGAVSGKQEFYSLSREYPLCCVCPSPTKTSCIVRFNLFVKSYRAMLEFYRLLADSEMESTKADFALFTVNTSNCDFSSFVSSSSSSLSSSPSSASLSSLLTKASTPCTVQLALKHCPYLDPYPLTSAYLTFFVRNMTALRTVLPGKAVEVGPNTYLLKDPDGNCVVAHDVQPAFVLRSQRSLQPRSCRNNASNPLGHKHCQLLKASPSHSSSYCESQDSGRFSDSDPSGVCSEVDQCLERLVKDVSLDITDYSESSDTDSSDHWDLDDSGTFMTRAKPGCQDPVDCCQSRKIQIGGLGAIQHVTKEKVVYL